MSLVWGPAADIPVPEAHALREHAVPQEDLDQDLGEREDLILFFQFDFFTDL